MIGRFLGYEQCLISDTQIIMHDLLCTRRQGWHIDAHEENLILYDGSIRIG